MSRLDDLCQQALDKWGPNAEISKAIEELAELIVAINHFFSGKIPKEFLLEEIADVSIMLNQLRIILGQSQENIDEYIDMKLDKLVKVLNKEG